MINKFRFPAILAVLMAGSLVFGAIGPQQKLMAKRAAELDAYRNMAERIMGLRVSSESYVLDFVVLSDEIKTSMDHFIKGLRIDEKQIAWYNDGSCEVAVEVSVSKVIKELKTTANKYYKGDKWTQQTFDNIKTYSKERVLTEYGGGVVRKQSFVADPRDAAILRYLTDPRPGRRVWAGMNAKTPAQKRLMAKRIARIDAYRKLIERIYGLRINSQTTVLSYDTHLSGDLIRGMLASELKGMRVNEVRYQADGVVEVQVSMTLKQVAQTLKKVCNEYYDKTGKRIRADKFDEIEKQSKRRTIVALGLGAV